MQSMEICKLYEEIKGGLYNTSVSELVFKVMQLSRLVGDQQLEHWAKLEYNGYYRGNAIIPKEVTVPEYRVVVGEFRNEYGQAVVFDDPEITRALRYPLRTSIKELEKLSARGNMHTVKDNAWFAIINQTWALNPGIVELRVPSLSLASVVETVRTKVMDGVYTLESKVVPHRALAASLLRISTAEPTATEQPSEAPSVTDKRVVFVVHGRNEEAREFVFDFLRSIGLQPLEWSEAIRATDKPSPYVGEVLDAAFSLAQAILVLLTPDDEARLREQYRRDSEPEDETRLTGQARPNVIFEAGMAMGRCQDRTVLAQIGQLRPFSNIGGRHILRLADNSKKRQELAQRLEAAGCPVNLDGTDWHTAGKFPKIQED